MASEAFEAPTNTTSDTVLTESDGNTLSTKVTPVKSFDQMNLKDALLRGIFAYGQA